MLSETKIKKLLQSGTVTNGISDGEVPYHSLLNHRLKGVEEAIAN